MKRYIDTNRITIHISVNRIEVLDQPMRPQTEEEKEKLKASIIEHGIVYPIVVYPSKDGISYIVIDGRTRLEIAKELEFEVVPCTLREDPVNAELLSIELETTRRHLDIKDLAEYEKLVEEKRRSGKDKVAYEQIDKYIISELQEYVKTHYDKTKNLDTVIQIAKMDIEMQEMLVSQKTKSKEKINITEDSNNILSDLQEQVESDKNNILKMKAEIKDLKERNEILQKSKQSDLESLILNPENKQAILERLGISEDANNETIQEKIEIEKTEIEKKYQQKLAKLEQKEKDINLELKLKEQINEKQKQEIIDYKIELSKLAKVTKALQNESEQAKEMIKTIVNPKSVTKKINNIHVEIDSLFSTISMIDVITINDSGQSILEELSKVQEKLSEIVFIVKKQLVQ